MKIVNIDAPERLARKILELGAAEFIYDVIRPLQTELLHCGSFDHQLECGSHCLTKANLPLSPIRTFEFSSYENVANLVHTIPIYLRDSRQAAVEEERENGIVDLLGAYFTATGSYGPYIELYLSNIEGEVKLDYEFKWLFTKVLIHELAHAALDIRNLEHCRSTHDQVAYNTPFGKWREESMANAIALRIIKEYGDSNFYEFSRAFMLSQPDEYALGVRMEDFGCWDMSSVVSGKAYGVNETLKTEWLKYAQGNPVWTELQKWNKILTSNYVYLFNGNYYTDD